MALPMAGQELMSHQTMWTQKLAIPALAPQVTRLQTVDRLADLPAKSRQQPSLPAPRKQRSQQQSEPVALATSRAHCCVWQRALADEEEKMAGWGGYSSVVPRHGALGEGG